MNDIPTIGTRVRMNKVNWNHEAGDKTGTITEIHHDRLNELVITVDPPYDRFNNHEYFGHRRNVELLIPIARTHQVKP